MEPGEGGGYAGGIDFAMAFPRAFAEGAALAAWL